MGLDEQAIKAVGTWLFVPAKRNGQPVPVHMSIELGFHLYKEPSH
jgi:outer membrane biosynthesis protein TonB